MKLGQIAMHELQDRCPRGAVWHVEDETEPWHPEASEPSGDFTQATRNRWMTRLRSGAVICRGVAVSWRARKAGADGALSNDNERVVAKLGR